MSGLLLEERHRWALYVEELQRAMGLTDWSVIIDAEPAGEDCDAQILPTWGARSATLQIDPKLHEHTPGRVRVVIVHELLHLHHAQPDQLAETALHTQGPGAHAAWNLAMEYAIDAVSKSWAQRLPYPPRDLATPSNDVVRT